MSERRADEMLPVAAALAIAVDEEDTDAIERMLTTLSTNQLYALAVVLAAHVDPDRPFVRTDIAAATKRAARHAAELFDIEVADIFGDSRRREHSEARMVTYYAAQLAGDNYSQIGRVMNRDHTSVISGVTRVGETPRLRAIARQIAERLGWENGKQSA
jgi:chromosomal replication initiation ATPase DnaA